MVATSGDRALLFGGNTAAGPDNQTWLLDLTNDAWQQLEARGTAPARESHDAVWLRSHGSMLIFGGHAGGQLLDDLWEVRVA
jgi:hypothetical protein